MRILVTDGMDKSAMQQLRAGGHEVVEQFYEPAELGAALRDFDCVVIRSATKKAGFDNLKGHKSVGGLRASTYNAMPIEGVEALVECLKKFEAEHK